MVAVPSATEVTRPVDDTVATAAFEVVHVTVAPAIVPPSWSLTVADNWDVAPSDTRLRLVSERVIEVATRVGAGVGSGVGVGVGVGVTSGPVVSPPHEANRNNKAAIRPDRYIKLRHGVVGP